MVACLVVTLSLPTFAATQEITLDMHTRVYVVTQKSIVGKKNQLSVGDMVPSKVWRDVIIDGRVVVAAGTPVLVQVDSVTRAKIAGRKGSLSLGALETESIDGRTVQLTGGYNKEGTGRMAGTIIGAVFLWPLIFIKGKAATLPSGSVFDVYTGAKLKLTIEEQNKPRTIDLSSLLSEFRVEVLYDELERQEKPTHFEFLIRVPSGGPREFAIDSLNGEPTDPISLEIRDVEETDDLHEIQMQGRARAEDAERPQLAVGGRLSHRPLLPRRRRPRRRLSP